jgi:hypothetical protein
MTQYDARRETLSTPRPQERTDDQMNAPTQLPSTDYDVLVIGVASAKAPAAGM